jgi:hypothetical protein
VLNASTPTNPNREAAPGPSHEQLNVYVQDRNGNPLKAKVLLYSPDSQESLAEIDTSGLANRPAIFRVPKGIPAVQLEVNYGKHREKTNAIAVAERNWTFTVPTSLGVLQLAIQAVPAVKYALGVAGIAAAIALVTSLKIDLRVAGWGTVVMLVLMGVLFLFNKVTQSHANMFVGPVKVFSWFVLSLFMATSGCLFSSVFFSHPVDLRSWLTKGEVGTSSSTERVGLEVTGSVISARDSRGIPRATVSTIGGQDRTITDDDGNFYLELKHESSDSKQLPVNVRVSAEGYQTLSWLVIAPAKNVTLPISPTESSARSNSNTGASVPRRGPTNPTLDEQYQRQFNEAQANEDHLIKFAEQAYASQNYSWTVKFLNQAKQVTANKEWEHDYPLLAAATELNGGGHEQFKTILQEMLAEMRLNNSYLHDSTHAGAVLQNLSYVRNDLQPQSKKYIDDVVIPACLKIKKVLDGNVGA